MTNLGRSHGGRLLYVKRDDCTGLAFGGNKVRQLEFYLGEAVAKGADTVLISGAVQSNFVRLIAAACATLGLRCHIQLEQRVPQTDTISFSPPFIISEEEIDTAVTAFTESTDVVTQQLVDEGVWRPEA